MKVRDIKRVTINNNSWTKVDLQDNESWEFLESYYQEEIITDHDALDQYLDTIFPAVIELDEDLNRYFQEFQSDWFTQNIFYRGRRVYSQIEEESVDEVVNHERKKIYLKAKQNLFNHLNYLLEGEEIRYRKID